VEGRHDADERGDGAGAVVDGWVTEPSRHGGNRTLLEEPVRDACRQGLLLDLCGGDLRLTPDESAEIVQSTDGATASFFTELAHRAQLLAASDGDDRTGMAHIRAALAELTATREALAGSIQPGRPSTGR
jgi:hypothetical protein